MTRADGDEIYPGLVVHDQRVSGSITVGQSRLPVWAFVGCAVTEQWEFVEAGWEPSNYGYDAPALASFLTDLLEHRKEWGRLVLLLAEMERRSSTRRNYRHWLDVKKDRKRMADQLRRCLAELDEAKP